MTTTLANQLIIRWPWGVSKWRASTRVVVTTMVQRKLLELSSSSHVLLSLILGGASLVGGCASSSSHSSRSEESLGVAPYAPLGTGYEWTYAVKFPGQSGQRTIRILSEDNDGFFVDDSGGAFRVTPAGLRDRRRYLIRTPLEAGRHWSAVVSPYAVEKYEIISVGQPCESLAGRFSDCIVVQSKLRRDDKVSLQGQFTWARGIGLIKIETTAVIKNRGEVPQTEQNLMSYKLGDLEGPRHKVTLPKPKPLRPPSKSSPKDEDESGPSTWGR